MNQYWIKPDGTAVECPEGHFNCLKRIFYVEDLPDADRKLYFLIKELPDRGWVRVSGDTVILGNIKDLKVFDVLQDVLLKIGLPQYQIFLEDKYRTIKLDDIKKYPLNELLYHKVFSSLYKQSDASDAYDKGIGEWQPTWQEETGEGSLGGSDKEIEFMKQDFLPEVWLQQQLLQYLKKNYPGDKSKIPPEDDWGLPTVGYDVVKRLKKRGEESLLDVGGVHAHIHDDGYWSVYASGWWGPNDLTLLGVYAILQPTMDYDDWKEKVIARSPSYKEKDISNTDIYWVYLKNENYFTLTGGQGASTPWSDAEEQLDDGRFVQGYYEQDAREVEKAIDECLKELATGKSEEQMAKDSKKNWFETFYYYIDENVDKEFIPTSPDDYVAEWEASREQKEEETKPENKEKQKEDKERWQRRMMGKRAEIPDIEYRWEIDGIGQGHYGWNKDKMLQDAFDKSKETEYTIIFEQFKPERKILYVLWQGLNITSEWLTRKDREESNTSEQKEKKEQWQRRQMGKASALRKESFGGHSRQMARLIERAMRDIDRGEDHTYVSNGFNRNVRIVNNDMEVTLYNTVIINADMSSKKILNVTDGGYNNALTHNDIYVSLNKLKDYGFDVDHVMENWSRSIYDSDPKKMEKIIQKQKEGDEEDRLRRNERARKRRQDIKEQKIKEEQRLRMMSEGEISDIPVKDLYDYANNVVYGRWPKGEPYIMKDPEYAVLYATFIIFGRWPEAEPYIIKDPEYTLAYAKEVIKGRWEEVEPIIATNASISVSYAIDIINGRFPLAEPVIAQDPNTAYRYAQEVIKGEWPEGEPAIAEDDYNAFKYATVVIERRFPLGEPKIMEGTWKDDYLEHFELDEKSVERSKKQEEKEQWQRRMMGKQSILEEKTVTINI